ncbi:MAG TPA: T9SS type A sorting domain-containing protein [Bacteroidales bacterium]|nr:T9SS type A sorting domain-containing protein [Bacteroidales bacterium]
MKKTFLISAFLTCTAIGSSGQEFIHNSSVTGICYAGTKVRREYTPPPSAFFTKSSKSGGNITVYYTGFGAAAKTAFEYAVSILESVLPADTKLTISASWERLSGGGVLANTSITGYAAGWGINALNPLAYYPIALAEKISGSDMNAPQEADLFMKVNSTVNWYLGTDGKTPVTQYDLVTVAIHEICHGLGFFDSMNSDGSSGYYGLGSLPVVYDGFVENASGQKLIDTLIFKNNSAALYQQLTADKLYFNGPLVKSANQGFRIKLYCPPKWDSGSSVSHVDESLHDENGKSLLMSPYLDLGEAIHNPGKLTLAVLGDLGWVNTRIIHRAAGDTEDAQREVTLNVSIKSDTTYNQDRVAVVFSFDSFKTSDTLYMIPSGTPHQYKTTVGIPAYNSDLQYYFFTEDIFHRVYRAPSLYDAMRFSSYIGTDTVRPIIEHAPVTYCLETTDSLKFNTLAADNIGIDSVYIEYKVNTGNSHYLSLAMKGEESYSAALDLKKLNVAGGDSVRYRIVAVDSAHNANITMLPDKDFYVLPVEKIESVVDSYSTDFSGAAADFFNMGFNISKPEGFTASGLHTIHPYESPETENGSIDYMALLRHPVRFSASGLLITFREIVLVEPGETGSVYGSPDFYDYVIVEGSPDYGKTWLPLADGYDSRYDKSWEDAYNSNIPDINSLTAGNESMLKIHRVYYKPSDKIKPGDTVLIRFRLYSDPFANGWGWLIEDLKINALINSVESNGQSQVRAYPNPGNGVIRLTGDNDINNSKSLMYSVYGLDGSVHLVNHPYDGSGIIDISSLETGMYLVVLQKGNRKIVIRYTLIR